MVGAAAGGLADGEEEGEVAGEELGVDAERGMVWVWEVERVVRRV